MAPTRSYTVDRDHNKASELAIGHSNFTLTNVGANVGRSVSDWQ